MYTHPDYQINAYLKPSSRPRVIFGEVDTVEPTPTGITPVKPLDFSP